jgi:hypothetical protein
MVIFDAEYDLRCPVVSTLHIEESGRAIFTTCTKVNYFDLIVFIICEKNVLRLHIAMNNAFILHIFESLAHLLCDYF